MTRSSATAASSMAWASAAGSAPVIQPASSPTTPTRPPRLGGDHRAACGHGLGGDLANGSSTPTGRSPPGRRRGGGGRPTPAPARPSRCGGRRLPRRALCAGMGPSPTICRVAPGCRTRSPRLEQQVEALVPGELAHEDERSARGRIGSPAGAATPLYLRRTGSASKSASADQPRLHRPLLMAIDVSEVRASRRKIDVAPVTRRWRRASPGSSGGGRPAPAIPAGTGGSRRRRGSRCPRRHTIRMFRAVHTTGTSPCTAPPRDAGGEQRGTGCARAPRRAGRRRGRPRTRRAAELDQVVLSGGAPGAPGRPPARRRCWPGARGPRGRRAATSTSWSTDTFSPPTARRPSTGCAPRAPAGGLRVAPPGAVPWPAVGAATYPPPVAVRRSPHTSW